MRHPAHRLALLGLAALLACGGEKPPATPPPAPAPEVKPAPAAEPAPAPAEAKPAEPAAPAAPAAEAKPAEPKPSTAGAAPAKPVAEPKPAVEPKPAPEAKPAAEAKPAPAPEAKPAPAAEPAAPAHAKVGPTKCKMCHRVQFESWQASAHAAKGLDCEGCHGNGGDYFPMAIMKDRQKSIENGLVVQTVASCKRCHPDATAALLPKAHAHKAK